MWFALRAHHYESARSWTLALDLNNVPIIRHLLERFGLATPSPRPAEEAVLIRLDGTSLPPSVYEQHDLATLEEQLRAVIARGDLGEYDGDETGPGETTVYLYGRDAERLFAGIEATLRANPLCRNAQVTIRRGPPGAAQREVRLA